MFAKHLETIQNATTNLSEAGTTALVSQCEYKCDQYLQALHKEKMYIQIDTKELPSVIEQIKTLCTLILANHMSGKTAGQILELLLLKREVSIEELLEEFPWTEDERHNFTNVTINLVQENIITQNGTNFSLKQ